MTTNVHDQPNLGRYEATVDGQLAGFAAYRRENAVITFTHTEVDDRFEGQGVGSQLVREALDDARAAGSPVRVECPFVRAYVDRHPEYQDLLIS
jgi:predicted GNAT family acetyltransferase